MNKILFAIILAGLGCFGAGCSQQASSNIVPSSNVANESTSTIATSEKQPTVIQPIEPTNNSKAQTAEFPIKIGETVEIEFEGGGAGPVPARVALDEIVSDNGKPSIAKLTVQWGDVTQKIILYPKEPIKRVIDINEPAFPLTVQLTDVFTSTGIRLKVTTPYVEDGGL